LPPGRRTLRKPVVKPARQKGTHAFSASAGFGTAANSETQPIKPARSWRTAWKTMWFDITIVAIGIAILAVLSPS
jgi:hypothetical protein